MGRLLVVGDDEGVKVVRGWRVGKIVMGGDQNLSPTSICLVVTSRLF